VHNWGCVHIDMLTYHNLSNQFQNKSYLSGRTHIYEHATPPNYRV
jgi:hypothetical protein